jgi:hypothetical protein
MIPRPASRRTGSDQDPGEEDAYLIASFLAGVSPAPTFPLQPSRSNPSLRD